jgi:hypothetical protein
VTLSCRERYPELVTRDAGLTVLGCYVAPGSPGGSSHAIVSVDNSYVPLEIRKERRQTSIAQGLYVIRALTVSGASTSLWLVPSHRVAIANLCTFQDAAVSIG